MFVFLLTTVMGGDALVAPTIVAQTPDSNSTAQIYRPPNRKKASSRGTRESGASRGGCPQKLESKITLIVPEDHVPLTISPHPTFNWYQEQELSLPVKFTLLEPGHQPIYSQELLLNKTGLIGLTLPEDIPPLEIGKKYRWSVSIICNRQYPSQNPYAESWVERIALSAEVASGLDREEQFCDSQAFAQAGIWYDSLACALEPTSGAKNLNILGILLNQVDLGYILEQEDSISKNNQIEVE